MDGHLLTLDGLKEAAGVRVGLRRRYDMHVVAAPHEARCQPFCKPGCAVYIWVERVAPEQNALRLRGVSLAHEVLGPLSRRQALLEQLPVYSARTPNLRNTAPLAPQWRENYG